MATGFEAKDRVVAHGGTVRGMVSNPDYFGDGSFVSVILDGPEHCLYRPSELALDAKYYDALYPDQAAEAEYYDHLARNESGVCSCETCIARL